MDDGDIIGRKFGRLTAVRRVIIWNRNGKQEKGYLCECSCGNVAIIRSRCLTNGNTKSCGCLWREHLDLFKGKKPVNFKHGLSKTRIYNTQKGMLSRCYNKNNQDYANYGGRGIRVCEEWKNVENFYKWAIENGYSEELSIDRIDVNGNYEPSNCRWVTKKEQDYNKRNTRRYMFRGKMLNIKELMEFSSVRIETLRHRLVCGWDVEAAVLRPLDISTRFHRK